MKICVKKPKICKKNYEENEEKKRSMDKSSLVLVCNLLGQEKGYKLFDLFRPSERIAFWFWCYFAGLVLTHEYCSCKLWIILFYSSKAFLRVLELSVYILITLSLVTLQCNGKMVLLTVLSRFIIWPAWFKAKSGRLAGLV